MDEPEPDITQMPDPDLIDRARELYLRLMDLPGWHDHRGPLLDSWRACIAEMDRRALPDYITQIGHVLNHRLEKDQESEV